jgi:transcriptional regulator with XRE-family HTH domain
MSVRSQSHAALGRAVKEFRSVRGVSQEDLAHLSGMHRTYLGGIERGERNVSYANLKRLAQALEVPASELLARAEEYERDSPGQ